MKYKYLMAFLRNIVVAACLPFFVGAFGCTSHKSHRELLNGLDTVALQNYRFLDRDRNFISGSDTLLYSLFERLSALRLAEEAGLKEGVQSADIVSILQIGDSHIQAGISTYAIRTLFQRNFGNAGRGLIVPLRLAATNEPFDYRITSSAKWQGSFCAQRTPVNPTGISGMALKTDASNFNFKLELSLDTMGLGYAFDRVKVFHHAKAPLLRPTKELDVDISPDNLEAENLTEIYLTRLTDTLTLSGSTKENANYATPIFYGFSLENGKSGVLYHSVGINGACYTHYAKQPDIILQTRLLEPQLIVVSMGTNEASTSRFSREVLWDQVDGMISQLRMANPNATVLITTPAQNYKRTYSKGKRSVLLPNTTTEKVRDVLIEYAKEKGLPYWDMYSVCGGAGAAEKWREAGLFSRDKIHYTAEGYKLQGMLFYEALMNSYAYYLEK